MLLMISFVLASNLDKGKVSDTKDFEETVNYQASVLMNRSGPQQRLTTSTVSAEIEQSETLLEKG